MEKQYEPNFQTIKKQTINTAKELWYDYGILDRLSKAETEIQLGNIMTTARKHAEERSDKARGESRKKKSRKKKSNRKS